VLVDIYQPGRL